MLPENILGVGIIVEEFIQQGVLFRCVPGHRSLLWLVSELTSYTVICTSPVHLTINVLMAHRAVFLACQILGDAYVQLGFLPTHYVLTDCPYAEQQQLAYRTNSLRTVWRL